MNERIKEQALIASEYAMKSLRALNGGDQAKQLQTYSDAYNAKFAELIVEECINREILLDAIARGWCSEKNKHKIMDADLALDIFDEVEKQIKKHFGVEE